MVDYTLGINHSNSRYNKYYNTSTSVDNRYDNMMETRQQNNNSFKECPDFSKCKCERILKEDTNGNEYYETACMGEFCGIDNYGNEICNKIDCTSIVAPDCDGPTEQGPGLTSCNRCLPRRNNTTATPQYQVTARGVNTNNNNNTSSGNGANNSYSNNNTRGNFITINVPDNLLNDPVKMNEIISLIREYLITEEVDISNIYRHYENRETTTEAITTSQAPQNNSFESNNASNNQTPRQRVIGLVNNLSVEELKELMILLMDMDLDQTKSSNVFRLLNAIKQQLLKSYNSSHEVESQLANHQIKSVEQLKNKLKEIDPETYEALFGSDRTHKYNTSYIPGFQYTPPELWPLHQFKSPVCLKDKNQVSDPAFVFDKGTPVNALDYEGLQQLPEFLYYESQTQDEAEAMKAKKQIDHLCQTKCNNNCDFPICRALNCSNCNY